MVLQLNIQRWLNQPLHAVVSPSKFHRNQSPGNVGKMYTANRHLRSEETHGVAYEKPVILNPFTSNKRMPGTKHVARQLCKTSGRSRLTHHIDLHTPLRQPQINKNFKTQYLMLYTKTKQFNVGHSSFLIAFPVRINYVIDQKLPTVSWTCHERCLDLPHAARISKVHCQNTDTKGLVVTGYLTQMQNQLFRCFHPSDHFQKY
jgi:hypothetical protein